MIAEENLNENPENVPNLENIQKLVDELRSGKYKQARGQLAITQLDNTEGYCCLGVACEVAIANGVPVEKRRDENNAWEILYDDASGTLPISVQNFYGFATSNPTLTVDLLAALDHGLLSHYLERSHPGSTKGEAEIAFREFLQDFRQTTGHDWQPSATALNDSLRWNFDLIADVFERTFLTTPRETELPITDGTKPTETAHTDAPDPPQT